MSFKNTIFGFYLVAGLFICLCYSVVAANGWKAPNFGVLDGSSGGSGRSYGGSWGGGK